MHTTYDTDHDLCDVGVKDYDRSLGSNGVGQCGITYDPFKYLDDH